MKRSSLPGLITLVAALSLLASCLHNNPSPKSQPVAAAQVPTWSAQDMDFFLHGSMSTELVPEKVLRTWIEVYPDLFPTRDLIHLGLIPDPDFGWPVGFSRSKPEHLGGLSSVGVNCASCHVGEILESPDAKPVRVLGMTSHFDAEAFFNSVIAASFRTQQPENMKKFLTAYVGPIDSQWQQQEQKILAAMAQPPTGGLLPLTQDELTQPSDLAEISRSMLKLFHNIRFAVHVPDQPPEKLPPPSGPGRNDAFGLLSLVLFSDPQPYSPVKYGLVWNLENRYWVHWDGNTRSPIGRNLLASLGLGAPLIGNHGELDFALVDRHTKLSERIQPPKYSWAIDETAAARGRATYQAQCASCHDGAESDARLYSITEVGTDPLRGRDFGQKQAGNFNRFLANLETPGYQPATGSGLRSTQKYWAASLAGVWARSPYLHNGSVRTMSELLASPSSRAAAFHRGSRLYDQANMGYADDGPYLLNTATPGNSNSGHDYASGLSDAQKRDLIEYLKTL